MNQTYVHLHSYACPSFRFNTQLVEKRTYVDHSTLVFPSTLFSPLLNAYFPVSNKHYKNIFYITKNNTFNSRVKVGLDRVENERKKEIMMSE